MVKRFQSPNLRRVRVVKDDTSISVEPEFWDQFRLITMMQGTTISRLLAEINRTGRLLGATAYAH
jgi:predicted DNA-binding ribbon-helix-helix protein